MIHRRHLTLTALFAALGFVLIATLSGLSSPSASPGGESDGGIAVAPPEMIPGAIGGGDIVQREGEDVVAVDGKGVTDRSIIRRADIGITVDDVAATLERAESVIAALGGETNSSSIGGWVEPLLTEDRKGASAPAPASAYALFRVPADRLLDAVDAIRAIGEVTSYSTGSDDVTAVVTDLDARLVALRAAESTYLALIERATAVADVMAVYAALTEMRAQIESLEAQLRSYESQVQMASISLSLTRAPAPIEEATEGFDPAAIVERAIGDVAGLGRSVASLLIYLGVVLLPIFLIGGGVVVVRRLRRPRGR